MLSPASRTASIGSIGSLGVKSAQLQDGFVESGSRETLTLKHSEGVRFYTFGLYANDLEIQQLTIRYESALKIHQRLQDEEELKQEFDDMVAFPPKKAGVVSPGRTNWNERAEGIRAYYQGLFKRKAIVEHSVFREEFGFGYLELKQRACHVARKVQSDSQCIDSAVQHLNAAGKILRISQQSDRIFLWPHLLVKAINDILFADSPDGPWSQSQHDDTFPGWFGHELLPALSEVAHLRDDGDDGEMQFFLELLMGAGLLVETQEGWLLPLRLPVFDGTAEKSQVMAQTKFERFIRRIPIKDGDPLDGIDAKPLVTLEEAATFISKAKRGAPSEEDLRLAVRAAYEKADQILLGRLVDEHGLDREDIAAINIYTQDKWRGVIKNLYGPLNAALRADDREGLTPYWSYIKLLQYALFKLPRDKTGTLIRGIRVKNIAEERERLAERSTQFFSRKGQLSCVLLRDHSCSTSVDVTSRHLEELPGPAQAWP